ncbi:MAG TPA: adenylate/guanylate cyclase domain-containing protein, partial [Solirubrobacteraceae bacterium]|nr:adenylate/guanylate cyclase domain-containing protein [Solirubrobacteraceae bacterium]
MKLRGRALALLAVALIAATVGLVLLATDALRGPERSTVDARFDVRGTQPTDGVVVVGIDDRTLAEDPNVGFPLNRHRHARVIEELKKAGAAVIAFDIQFTQPSRFPSADNALIEGIRAGAPRVVLATTGVNRRGKTKILGGGAGLKYSRATPAFSGFDNDEDGVARHVAKPSENGLESFALAAARIKLGHAVKQPPTESTWLDFAGPNGTMPHLSYGDVERGSFNPDQVRGKVVVIGGTAPALQDIHRTATDDAMSGPELQATWIATALDGFPLRDGAGWIDIVLVLVMAAAAPLVAVRFGSLFALVAAVVATGLFLLGVQLAFNAGTVLTVTPALAAMSVGLVGTLAVSAPLGHPLVNRFLDRLSPAVGNVRTRRIRTLLLLSAALFCALGPLGLMAIDALRRLDLTSVDMRFDVRGTEPQPDDVVVVGIDDHSLNAAGNIYPFTRKLHARVIRNLAKAGAAVIAYDVQFTQESKSLAADNALIEAVRAGKGHVVMATTAVDPGGKVQIFGGDAGLAYSRAKPGYSNFEADPDGVTRHMLDAENGVGALPVVAAEIKLGRDVNAPPGNTAWIDYAGPPRTFRYLSFIDVARGRFPPAAVAGKVVVVGGTATILQDQRPTATTGELQMPGPEVHANAIHTALEGFPLESGPGWLNTLLVVVLGVAAPFAAIRLRMLYAIPIGVLALGALLVGAQVAFENDVIIQVIYALVAGLAALLATAAIHGVTVAFERANTRDAFARFVPESVVDQVLQDAEGVRLGGVRGEATVMFSDLRGFTSFAETLQPEQVIDALNRYLTAMSEAILDHGGTLVAYMGDGIMAVFGAPMQQDDHADRALAAARDMLTQLEGFNAWLRSQDLHQGFKMGIGLNTGPVMSGNVGSERR